MKLRVTVQGKSYEVDVEVLESDGGAPAQQPSAPAAAPAPAASSPQQAPAPAPAEETSSQPAATAAGDKVYPAPLAGTVHAIHVKPGDSVNANDELMVLEAMKMETSVSAPGAGKIKAILVNVGDAVSAGQPLVEFE